MAKFFPLALHAWPLYVGVPIKRGLPTPLGVLGIGFPNVHQTGTFLDAQDLGSMGEGHNSGFKTQEPGSILCFTAELLGTHHYRLLGLSFLICQIDIKTPAWLH